MSTILEARFISSTSPEIVRDIDGIVKSEKIDVIWVVLSNLPLITVADRLLRNAKTPIIISVLDDPGYFARNQSLDPITWNAIQRTFARVIRRAFRISVISETMQARYRERYGVESVVIRHGIDEKHFLPWKGVEPDSNQLTISFAGSLYAKREWNSLIASIEKSKGFVLDRKVRISFIGRFPLTGAKTANFVVEHGPKSFPDTLTLLHASDIAYLPYWFDRRHSDTVKTSFPGKLSAYAACGIPVLYHGPQNSSVTPFLSNHPFGISCHELSADAIRSAIENLVVDKSFSANAAYARFRAFTTELSRSVMLQRFFDFCSLNTERTKT